MSAPMVRAILAGAKTQTRRVVKPRKDRDLGCELAACELAGEVNGGEYRNAYCAPGDLLWVRESFSGPHYQDRHPPRDWHSSDEIHYWADGCPACGDWTKPRPGMFMPRWASRITLEVTGVRVERLQDISETDALAEGIDRHDVLTDGNPPPGFHRETYQKLWESINGPGSWDANPWVWVVEFRRIDAAMGEKP